MSKHYRKSLPSNIKPLVSAIATCLVLSSPAHATTYIVDNITDAATGSLRAAIILANANAGEDTINFASGLNNSTITLASQIDITDAAAPLIIDASTLANGITISGNNLSRIFGVTEVQKLTLNNLTVTAGSTTGNSSGSTDCATSALGVFTAGGAICTEGEIELIDTTISNSSTVGTAANGGGFLASSTTLTNSTVSGNRTEGVNASGGGFLTNSTTLINSTVSGNSTVESNSSGGGFLASSTTLINSTVSGNSTAEDNSFGGGFFASGPTTLTDSMVLNNNTNGSFVPGGGFMAFGTVTLTNSTISGNSTVGNSCQGGGICCL